MDAASAYLWLPGEDNNSRSGTGSLVLGTAGLDCAKAKSGAPDTGSGLWMDLTYFTGMDDGQPEPAWDGLFIQGTAGDAGTPAERGLQVSGWHEGVMYDFAGGDAWVRVDEGRTDSFRGEFATTWWFGGFDAQVCGGGDESGDDTGA